MCVCLFCWETATVRPYVYMLLHHDAIHRRIQVSSRFAEQAIGRSPDPPEMACLFNFFMCNAADCTHHVVMGFNGDQRLADTAF